MKIISKFKDYYDYKVAEYGTDENLVYDRRLPTGVDIGTPQRSWITLENAADDEALHSALYVGNTLVHLFATPSKIYTHWDFANPDDWHYDLFDLWYGNRYVLMNDGKEIRITSYRLLVIPCWNKWKPHVSRISLSWKTDPLGWC